VVVNLMLKVNNTCEQLLFVLFEKSKILKSNTR